MNFKEAEKRFKQLKTQFTTGSLSEVEFRAQLEKLMVQDGQGNWWIIGYETELWYRHDGTNWVQIDPPNHLLKKSTLTVPTKPQSMDHKDSNIAFREGVTKFRGIISQRSIIVIIVVLISGLTLIGGYSIGKNVTQGSIITSSTTKSVTKVSSNTSTATFTRKPSQTPKPSSTPVMVFHANVDATKAYMYQGPGLEYYQVDQALYQNNEELIVIAKDLSGLWFLCEAEDGNSGWLYLDWIRFTFDPEVISTASSIPPVPPTPTRKPKPDSPQPQPTCGSPPC